MDIENLRVTLLFLSLRKCCANPNLPKRENFIEIDFMHSSLLSFLGMQNAKEQEEKMGAYTQVWSGDDLKPDTLTHELNTQYVYDQEETEKRNDTDKYFKDTLKSSLSAKANASAEASGRIGPVKLGSVKGSVDTSMSANLDIEGTTHNKISLTEINKALEKRSVKAEWDGQKIQPKSFKVFKVDDLAGHLTVAIVNQQLSATKTKGAVVLTISALNSAPTPGQQNQGKFLEDRERSPLFG